MYTENHHKISGFTLEILNINYSHDNIAKIIIVYRLFIE